ncbi:MAG: response regulator transcription factor [Opitutales bacterium]|jgi:DNA-binding NarL/FixJ family response regulator|nr:response regulator transcription factor [Opitutales bacterium]MDG2253538.1 response regulator transcription factor [Opitutaceae bacterium]MBT5168389.1 response regulator transcription factor [Opitutales bacterium]MBT5816665.1 response regulator transcription factor [Opitutales bacterium]MBT6380625.1 response regulator transcription factor [Opitutales bacterium]
MNTAQTRIVVIEDQIMLRDLVTSMAGSITGMNVVAEATDGREGMKSCEDENPDLVIFDLFLPGLNGMEILRQYGHKHPKTRFIAISANFTPDSIRELLELGCHGIIAKSSSAAKLKEGMREVCNGSGYLCPIAASLLRESHLTRGTSKKKGRLSNREREVLQAVAEGFSTKQIAEMLQLSVKTIEAHRANLMKKLDARSAVELTRCAYEMGIIELPARYNQPVASPPIS